MDGQHGVERILDGLEKIFEEHRPAENESDMRIQRLTDVGIDGARRRIYIGHAAETDGRYRHGHHGQQKRCDGVAAGEYLCFSEEWNGGDRRGEDDAVVDEVPDTQHPLEV